MSMEAKSGLKWSELCADVDRLVGSCQRRLEQENIFVLGCDAAAAAASSQARMNAVNFSGGSSVKGVREGQWMK